MKEQLEKLRKAIDETLHAMGDSTSMDPEQFIDYFNTQMEAFPDDAPDVKKRRVVALKEQTALAKSAFAAGSETTAVQEFAVVDATKDRATHQASPPGGEPGFDLVAALSQVIQTLDTAKVTPDEDEEKAEDEEEDEEKVTDEDEEKVTDEDEEKAVHADDKAQDEEEEKITPDEEEEKVTPEDDEEKAEDEDDDMVKAGVWAPDMNNPAFLEGKVDKDDPRRSWGDDPWDAVKR